MYSNETRENKRHRASDEAKKHQTHLLLSFLALRIRADASWIAANALLVEAFDDACWRDCLPDAEILMGDTL